MKPTKPLTRTQTLIFIRENCPQLTASCRDGEYRITLKVGTRDEKERLAYFTTDSQDAIDTARAIQAWVANS